MNLLKRPCIPDRIGILKCWFVGERKTGVPGEKPLGAWGENQQQTKPHVALTPGFEPGVIISKKSTRTHIHGEASFKGSYKSMALSTRLEVGYELKITL